MNFAKQTLKSSDEVNELFSALSKFQSEVPDIERTKTVTVKLKKGGQYGFSYSPLENTLKTIRPALTKNGLSITNTFNYNTIVTILGHSSGQWLRSDIPITLDHDNPQNTGEVITYKRRYAIESILGLSATDDVDANGVAGNSFKEKKSDTKPKTNKRSKDLKATEAMQYIRDTDNEDLEGFLSEDEDRSTVLGVWTSSVGDLPSYLAESEEEEPEEEEEPPFEPDDEKEEEPEPEEEEESDDDFPAFNPKDYDNKKDLVTEYTKLRKKHKGFKEKYFPAIQKRMQELD